MLVEGRVYRVSKVIVASRETRPNCSQERGARLAYDMLLAANQEQELQSNNKTCAEIELSANSGLPSEVVLPIMLHNTVKPMLFTT